MQKDHAAVGGDEWLGQTGRSWAEQWRRTDRSFSVLTERLLRRTREFAFGSVLDIGCGAGELSLAIGRGRPHCRVIGVDISPQLVDGARERGANHPNVSFELADAASWQPAEVFAPELLISRHGVMFFDDPVAAFANLRSALRPGGSLRAIAWRSAAENPFQTTAERAAAPFLPYLPPRDPDAPGQFGFGDGDRVRRILEASGWREIAVEPIDIACTMTASELETYFTRLGPVGGALPEADAGTRSRILDAVRPAFAPYVQGDTVRFTAACWQIGARY